LDAIDLTMRITRLSPELANQIAAGEVIERPASVVKELVENAIDAGARRITVTIELGGKRMIRVEDDGEGMDPEDARLAVERHATSKIRSAQDLAAIRTLGFRGEALPSIASVSRFRLRTRRKGAVGAIELTVDGGAPGELLEKGAPEGTLVEVGELFFNLPARRKFLKSDAAESAQISRLLTQFSLGYPEIAFTLTSAGRRVLQVSPAESLGERFFQVYGDRPELTGIQKETAGVRIRGFVATLTNTGAIRGPQNVFVNRRIVRDRTIAHAIIDAYSSATIKERSPEVHVFLELSPDRVDVNVHPTKAEVRFLEPSLVHEVLRRALHEALGAGRAQEIQLRPQPGAAPDSGLPVPRTLPGVWEGQPVSMPHGASPHGANLSVETFGSSPAERGESTDDVIGALALAGGLRTSSQGLVDRQAAAVDAVKPMIPLGQFRDTFIIAVDSDGILIIDQHVAHERVLFEQMLERLATGTLESQRLLEPLILDLPPAERQALARHARELTQLGFDVDEFGGAAVRLSAMPALLGMEQAADAIRALASDLESLHAGVSVDAAVRRLAATMACHAAVKANDPLTFEKMRYILAELRRTAYSSVCPHGRPVVLRITRREIERNFQRI
jgi:DNA mismatch repair protein MutL